MGLLLLFNQPAGGATGTAFESFVGGGMYLGRWEIDDALTFAAQTHDSTGAAANADADPTYAVYEDETAVAILSGTLGQLGAVTGFYTANIALTAANGFEVGKCYTLRIAATVGGTAAAKADVFQIETAETPAAVWAYADRQLTALDEDATTIDLNGTTIGTATNVGTVTGNVNGSVGSVTGNVGGNVTGSVGSVAGAVGSVTGNVGGNVTGSVGSVAGAVGSVTGNVGGNVVGSVASVTGNVGGSVASVTAPVTTGTVSDKTGYKLASDGLDTVSTTAPAGVATNFREMVVQTWRRMFKKATMTATQIKTYDDAGTGVVTTQSVSDDGTTQTQGAAT